MHWVRTFSSFISGVSNNCADGVSHLLAFAMRDVWSLSQQKKIPVPERLQTAMMKENYGHGVSET